MEKRFLILVILILTITYAKSQEEVSIEEQFIQTTSLIYTVNTSKSDTSAGTGFFYRDDKLFPNKTFLITNKHVVKDQDIGYLFFNKRNEKGQIYGNKEVVYVEDFESKRNFHPDPTVDLCFTDITELIINYNKNGKVLFTRLISKDLIPSDSIWNTITVYEDVIMIGYPSGLFDKFNNIPILRTGVTATPPKLDYNGRREFLIDIAAFPGSSGSPVFLKRMPYGVKKAKNGASIGFFPEYFFVGVLYAGPTYSPKIEKLKFESIPHVLDTSNYYKTKIMINLGNIIKSTEIEKMINHYLK